MSLATLIPEPKAVYPEPNFFQPPPEAAVHCPPAAAAIGRRVARQFGLPLQLDGSGWDLCVGTAAQPGGGLGVPSRPEAYAILVEPERILLSARDQRGLLYASLTLEDLGRGCGRVVDFPDLPVRGVHLDLKGPRIRTAYLRTLIERLGRLKINTLLLEYEDKFPYRNLPGIATEEALTAEELSGLLDFAAEWGIEIVPLVQCLGHNEYVLRHHNYRHLAEDERCQQLCPLHEESLSLFERMLDEMVSAHPRARMFHIGADESWSLGACESCAAFVKEHGAARLYLDYVRRVAELVVARGLQPILWDDMFHEEKCFHLLDELPEGTILMPWEYQAYEHENSHIRWGKTLRYASRRYARQPERLWGWSGWLEDLPEEEQQLLRALKFSGDDPELGEPLPWVRAAIARGRRVIGASAARGADHDNALFPSWQRRFANIAVWARQAAHYGIDGVISTAWSRWSSSRPPVEPWETGWYTVTASAELYWNTDTSRERFERRFGPTLAQALYWIAEGTHSRRRHFLHAALDLLGEHAIAGAVPLCARYALLVLESEELERGAGWQLYYHQSDDRDPARADARAAQRSAIADLLTRWAAWAQDAAGVFLAELEPAGAQELVDTKVFPYQARLRRLYEQLEDRP